VIAALTMTLLACLLLLLPLGVRNDLFIFVEDEDHVRRLSMQ
jgi:hypothetical protein